MFDISMSEPSGEFALCWQAAGRHLNRRVDTRSLSWLKADLTPPFLEHLSFRLGNQLFFVRVSDVDGSLELPGSTEGLLSIADGCRGHACEMPMTNRAGQWVPVLPGWGLSDVVTGQRVDPPSFVTAEPIVMSDWELHDFGVQIVRDQLRAKGRQIMSTSSNPAIYPSLWFVGDGGPEWVVVRVSRYPDPKPEPPDDWKNIQTACERLSPVGYFAAVGVANGSDPFDGVPGSSLPLWRGHSMVVSYSGLERGGTAIEQ